MSGDSRLFILIGCVLLAIAGALAAFGVHGPADILTPERRPTWAWAVEMQFYHSIGLLLVGVLINQLGSARLFSVAAALMIGGMLIFSGLIYVRSFGLLDGFAALVPYGGMMLMLSWLVLAAGIWRAGRN